MWLDTTCETEFEILCTHSEGCDKKRYDLCIFSYNDIKRILFMQVDVGSVKVCFTSALIFF